MSFRGRNTPPMAAEDFDKLVQHSAHLDVLREGDFIPAHAVMKLLVDGVPVEVERLVEQHSGNGPKWTWMLVKRAAEFAFETLPQGTRRFRVGPNNLLAEVDERGTVYHSLIKERP